MNYSIIRYITGLVLKFEAAFLILPCVTSLIYREQEGKAFFIVAICSLVLGILLSGKKPKNQQFFAKEGFVIVALCWIVLSIVGALPFVISGDIPSFIDALFETISGFTTTGASILSDVEALSHTSLIWRSFTHWVGGMGVFVLILAVLPLAGGYNMNLMRAESPGPDVGKLVPRLRDTAKILYMIYFAMTIIQIILLLAVRMPLFDTLCITFGSAGTGGFGIKNSSMADYSIAMQVIVTVFMILFGVNFNFYYILLLGKHKKDVFKMQEVWTYLLIILTSIVIITFNIAGMFDSIWIALKDAAFQVGSIITTTGYSTTDFDLWPQLSRTILVMLMLIGACAGSTGGGIKVSRIIILFKLVKCELDRFIHPRSVRKARMDGKVLEEGVARSVSIFLITYVIIYAVSMFILAFDNLDLVTNFTAIAATFNNIGPGLAKVGPTSNFGVFSPLAKFVLMFDMLAGRLELYPMLVIFVPSVWKRR